LLDEHIPPAVVEAVQRLHAGASIVSLRDWKNGAFLGRGDDEILAAAHTLRFTLVTYDVRTIPSLLKRWAESGIRHGGIIFVDQRTLRPSDMGGLARTLAMVIQRYSARDWTNPLLFLER